MAHSTEALYLLCLREGGAWGVACRARDSPVLQGRLRPHRELAVLYLHWFVGARPSGRQHRGVETLRMSGQQGKAVSDAGERTLDVPA